MNNPLVDFLIIGVQRCGTTSLRNYLASHPDVTMHSQEVNFWNDHYSKGIAWYDAILGNHPNKLRGEKSPNYIADPDVPARIRKYSPHTKLVILLRDPVHRAWSHYRHAVHHHLDTPPFRWNRPSKQWGWHTYVKRGYYAQQIKHWMKIFPASQMLIIVSEDLFSTPDDIYRTVRNFLGLALHTPKSFRKHGTVSYKEDMPPELEAQLRNHYYSYNQELYELLSTDLGWNDQIS